MKRKLSIFFVSAAVVYMLLPIRVFSHPGKTDSSGGHNNRSAGGYHFHHGYSAHAHSDMDGDGDIDCPYKFKNNESQQYASSSAKSEIRDQNSDYDKGFSAGEFAGLAEGRKQGYELGIDAAQKEFESRLVESENNAYATSAAVGVPLFIVASALSSRKRQKSEAKLRREIEQLKKELAQTKGPGFRNENPVIETVKSTTTAQSSFISSVSYTSKGLLVTLSTGGKYLYYNVPEEIYDEMIAASSIGKYYHQNIKDHFPYKSVQ